MIPLDTFTLAAVAAELRETILGARVQKIQQPSPNEIVISFYGRGGAHRLLISADPQTFRAHLTQIRRENPINPPGFCAVCRKYLDGAWLESIEMPQFDRVLHLRFRAHDGEAMTLVAELVGRNSNVVLVSGTGLVRGAMRPSPNDVRVLRPGAVYADPPGYGEGSGISRFAEAEIAARGPSGLDELMTAMRENRFAPHSLADADGSTVGVWAFAPKTMPGFARESVGVALDTFHATQSGRAAEASLRGQLTRALQRETAFRDKEIKSAQATLAEAERADEYEQSGNLLLAHLSGVERAAPVTTIPDDYLGGERTIFLDPKKSAAENAEAHFDRARKARDAAGYARERLADLEDERAVLRELASDLERADDDAALEAIQRRLTEMAGAQRVAGKPAQPRPAERPFGGHRIRTYTIGDDWTLLVGETAEANDYLTTKVASPSDLWLHVRAGTGAHGVLRTAGHATIPDAVVRRAAQIVAARSGTAVKHAGIVAVDVVEKRYVRKPRGAKPGLVTYTRERSLDVEPTL